MKYINNSFIFLLLLVLFVNGEIEVFAMNTGFSTETLSEKTINTFLSNVNIAILTDEPAKKAIECFDVNENGVIAIGQNDTNRKNLIVYSIDGIFQYGYTFQCAGSFAIEWNGDDINIYFARSDIIITVNREGQIIDSAKVPHTTENNTYKNYIRYSNERTLGNTRYILKNDMGIFNVSASSYSQLVVLGPAGEETILYDVNSAQLAKTVTEFILIAMFILIVAVGIAREFIKLNRKP